MRYPWRFTPAGRIRSLGYRLLWTAANALQRSANGCLCVAAGLLRRDELRAMSQTQWSGFCTSADDVDGGLYPWERRLYERVLHTSDRMLLVGCGAGRDLIALRERGFNVTGLEQTPELVELAREHLARRGLTGDVSTGFIETWPLDGPYDAVVFSNCCYSYVHPSASRVATLARIKSRLTPQGRVVILYTGLAHRSLLAARLTGLATRLSGADWRPEPGDSFSRDYHSESVLRYEHVFLPGEVANECAEAGLRVIEEDVLEGPFWSAIAVSR